jgi:hypothetical protein
MDLYMTWSKKTTTWTTPAHFSRNPGALAGDFGDLFKKFKVNLDISK